MNTAIITVKTDRETKKQAQELAQELGLSLSGALNALVKHFVRTRSLSIRADVEALEPTEYLKLALKESEADRKAGRVSPTFTNAEEAIAWLDSPEADKI